MSGKELAEWVVVREWKFEVCNFRVGALVNYSKVHQVAMVAVG